MDDQNLFLFGADGYMPASDQQILDAANRVVIRQLSGQVFDGSLDTAKKYLPALLAGKEIETVYLGHCDSEHRLICLEEKFHGTVDVVSVLPREIMRSVIKYNTEVLFIAHNHPRGNGEASDGDLNVTMNVAQALHTIGVKLLDHYVVSGTVVTSVKEVIHAKREVMMKDGPPPELMEAIAKYGEQMGVEIGGVAMIGPDGVHPIGGSGGGTKKH